MSSVPPDDYQNLKKQRYFCWLLLLFYLLFIIYGTLFPLTGWRKPSENLTSLFLSHRHSGYPDLLTNFILYIPLGFLVVRLRLPKGHFMSTISLAIVSGGILSLSLEYMQAFIPGRTTSLLDLVLNISGTMCGTLFALVFSKKITSWGWLSRLQHYFSYNSQLTNFGLLIVLIWVFSQLTPFVPSLDIGNIKDGLKPAWYTIKNPFSFSIYRTSLYIFSVAGLMLLVNTLLKLQDIRSKMFIGAFFIFILFLKIPIVSRQFSIESFTGTILGFLLYMMIQKAPKNLANLMSFFFIISFIVIEGTSGFSRIQTKSSSFNWIPFQSHMGNNLIGIADIFAGLWPFLALSYLALLAKPKYISRICVSGFLGIVILVFLLEWNQQFIPGRTADITDVVLASLAWTLPWLSPALRPVSQSIPADVSVNHY
jgi:VanZ family protein